MNQRRVRRQVRGAVARKPSAILTDSDIQSSLNLESDLSVHDQLVRVKEVLKQLRIKVREAKVALQKAERELADNVRAVKAQEKVVKQLKQ